MRAVHSFAVAECLHLLPMEINENPQVFSGFADRHWRWRRRKYTGIPENSAILAIIDDFGWTDASESILLKSSTNPAPMSRTSHRIRIHDILRLRLQRGEIGPEVRLVDHAIAAQMGVSRMPVREALMQLVSEGYLESTSRGFALPNLSPERIAEVFVLRRLLEPYAVACVARDRTDANLAAMRGALALAEAAGADVAAFHRGAEAFRIGWLEAVRNGELRHAIRRYSGQVQSVRFATLPDPDARKTILSGLQDLLHALGAGDGPQASDLMLRFIFDAETAYRRGQATGLIA